MHHLASHTSCVVRQNFDEKGKKMSTSPGRKLLSCAVALALALWCAPCAFASEAQEQTPPAEIAETATPSDSGDQAISAIESVAQNETVDVAAADSEEAAGNEGDNGISVLSVLNGLYVFQTDFEQENESTVVTVSLPNLDNLLATGKADTVSITATMRYNGKVTREVSKQQSLADLKIAGGSFTMDFKDYGKFTTIAKFYKNGQLIQTGDAQTIGITANEYNIAPVSATLPVTFFSLSMWGENNIRYNADGNIVPTFLLLERPNAYNWDNLPEGVYGLPFFSKDDLSYQPSDFGQASSLFRDRSQAMADYVADLYELNPSAKFNLYCVDYYLGLIQTILYANRIPQDQYTITVLSDGSYSYSQFSSTYSNSSPAQTHEDLKAQWEQAKQNAYRNGLADRNFKLDGPNRMLYAAVSSEPNAQWWLARPALLESTGDGNAFGKAAQADYAHVVRVFIDKKLAALQAQGNEAISEFKSLYNFSDSYFSEAAANGKDVMLFLGTTVGNEQGTFADYAKFAMTYYGDAYQYYYKGHPGSPTDFYPSKQQELANLDITDVDSSIAAELILFFYPDIYLSGYQSSTYASISNPEMAKGLFWTTKSAALASTNSDYSIMDWFMSPIGDSTDQAVKELAGNGTNYLIEFSDSILNTSNFDIAIWNPASETITYYAKNGNGYSFVSSNKPQDKQGEWILSGNRWWYRYADGTWPQNCLVSINGNTYAFDNDGWMITGWTPQFDNSWRYFDQSGEMHSGWLFDGGTWYHFASDTGAMNRGWFKDGSNWYFATASGAMQTGWLHNNNSWYYLSNSGSMATGWAMIDNQWYYFDASGAMQIGWISLDRNWYYLSNSGAMNKGWLFDNDSWYYLDDSGKMARNWAYINDSWYRFTESGVMQSGWLELDDIWYYFEPSGAMAHDQWHGDYYLLASGAMAKNAWIGQYYVDDNGVWAPNAQR